MATAAAEDPVAAIVVIEDVPVELVAAIVVTVLAERTVVDIECTVAVAETAAGTVAEALSPVVAAFVAVAAEHTAVAGSNNIATFDHMFEHSAYFHIDPALELHLMRYA